MSPYADIINNYAGISTSYASTGLAYAMSLFYKLALIQVVFSAIFWILFRKDPNQIVAELLKMFIIFGIFLALIMNQQSWIPMIVDSFKMIGIEMAGSTTLDPGAIFDRGVNIVSSVYVIAIERGLWKNFFSSLISISCAITIFYCFVKISLEMVLTIIGGNIILSAGTIVLGLSGLKASRQFAERYITAAITIGLKLLFLSVIIGIGQSLSDQWADSIINAPKKDFLQIHLDIVGSAFIYFAISTRVPDMAVSMLTGGFNTNFNANPAAMMMTAAKSMMIAGNTIANVAKEGAKHAAGSGSVLKEMVKSGQAAASDLSGKGLLGKTLQGAMFMGGAMESVAKGAYTAGKERLKDTIATTPGAKVANQMKNNRLTKQAQKEDTKQKVSQDKTLLGVGMGGIVNKSKRNARIKTI